MILQAALNGARPADTLALPVTPAAMAADAVAAREAGADCLHIHPRDGTGAESLAPANVAACLNAIRAAVPGMPVGISTGDWITPRAGRLDDMRGWTVLPDYVSVNLSESDAPQVMALMREMGIGIELGLASIADLDRLLSLPDSAAGALRAMIEMDQGALAPACDTARTLLDRLLRDLPGLPVLLHGFDATAWDFIALARDWGVPETRIGMEDVLHDRTGQPADNAALVAAAHALLRRPYPFPRPHDDETHAWGLEGDIPQAVWERFSPAYEAQAERLTRAYEAAGYSVEFGGAGSEDGEFIVGIAPDGVYAGLTHLEDPNEAKAIAALDSAALAAFIADRLAGKR